MTYSYLITITPLDLLISKIKHSSLLLTPATYVKKSDSIRFLASESKRLTLDLPLATMANQQYQHALEDGHGDEDMAAIYLALKKNEQHPY